MSSLLVFNRVYTGDTVRHVGIFEPSCRLVSLYLSPSYTSYTGVIHCVFDQIPRNKIALPLQTKPRREGGFRHLPPSPFTGKFLRKADI
jgi:hypothetical protein